jgi:hypothetical protein
VWWSKILDTARPSSESLERNTMIGVERFWAPVGVREKPVQLSLVVASRPMW